MNNISIDISGIDFYKGDGLVPAIIQDAKSKDVLMLGYMDKDALTQTVESKVVTFWSRSKQRLWVKGETSGNFLGLVSVKVDCDQDALLIEATPKGPVCHTGTYSCFGDQNGSELFLLSLQETIIDRKMNESDESYTSSLFKKGLNKIAQKVGEEATELIIEAKDNNDDLFLNEAADLMYHYLVLLSAKDKKLEDVIQVLKSRQK